MRDTVAESILALDIGAAFTKAALFDVVEGRRRFVANGQAPSTFHPPTGDPQDGLMRAAQRVVEVAGRPLLGAHGPEVPAQTSGGVDACVLVTSTGSPVRVLIAAMTQARFAAIQAEVTALACVNVVGREGVDTKKPVNESLVGNLIAALHESTPHAVVLEDDGSQQTRLAEAGQALAIAARAGSAAPLLLLAGPVESETILKATLPPEVKLERIAKQASAGSTPLQARLQALWQEVWREEIAGASSLDLWGGEAVVPAGHAFVNTLRFLAEQQQVDVWGLQLGAQTAIAASVVGGAVVANTRGDLGLGQGSAALLDDVSAITQWLPFKVSDSDVADAIVRKRFFPYSVPETKHDLQLEGALARVVAGGVLAALPVRHTTASRKPPLLVGGGAVLNGASEGDAALLLLDAFQPVGMVELAADRLGILPSIGAMAKQLPEAAAELMLGDGLDRLGPAIGIGGEAKDGGVAAQVTMEGEGRKSTVDVPYGSLRVLPAAKGAEVKLTVKPRGKLDCGAGPGRKVRFTARGGLLGLVIDARGRPLTPATLGDQRIERLTEWQNALSVRG